MEENRTGYIMPIKESVRSLKREGHRTRMIIVSFARPVRRIEWGKNLQSTLC